MPAPMRAADIVIEAFACELPASYLDAMRCRAPDAKWYNLEYLSAEDWVASCHLMHSRHPRLGLDKQFFFPGITPGTGGLIREDWLDRELPRFDALQWRQQFSVLHQLPAACVDALWVSMFAYENPRLPSLMKAWAEGAQPVVLIVPEGRASAEAGRIFGWPTLGAGQRATAGALTALGAPMTDLDRYDRMLWACDLNFVRGEDSFVRAQWAEQPLVWQIYPQADEAHLAKLEAALAHYCAALSEPAEQALAGFWRAWNGSAAAPFSNDMRSTWAQFQCRLPEYRRHAPQWARGLRELGDLASNLVQASKDRV